MQMEVSQMDIWHHPVDFGILPFSISSPVFSDSRLLLVFLLCSLLSLALAMTATHPASLCMNIIVVFDREFRLNGVI